MSTVLMSSGVVIATIVVIARVALGEEQGPLERSPRVQARSRGVGAASAPSGAITELPSGHAIAGHESELSAMRVYSARHTTSWARIRSGLVLVGLATVLGASAALAGIGVIVAVALGISSVTR